jgi:hypothetical protein
MTNLKQLAIGALLLAPAASHAALVGESVNGVFTVGGSPALSQNQTVVDPGIEFTSSGGSGASAQADLFDTGLSLILNTGGITSLGTVFGWVFTLLDPDITFTSVTEISDDWPAGSSFTGFSNGNKTINFSIPNQAVSGGTTYTATYTVATSAGQAPTPPPCSCCSAGSAPWPPSAAPGAESRLPTPVGSCQGIEKQSSVS